ncbi:MAG: hypothetical protein A3K19_20845 [Lentisphaerae bacterium RIFOXYB12_FULL_65_16]|nr:MAG: hypothetical protein A3K18_19270 [Lentisphaerae bacterium RIFOXYA12_64_32]OGV85183.1 MAG: hypothetical protein A3K19_20845 [Lentisphaerae bacterium RIFOXYB12_FULL_65_16]
MQEDRAVCTIDRRRFLGIVWGGALLALIGQSVAAMFHYIRPRATIGFGGKVLAGRVEEFAVGRVNRVLAGQFYIVRGEDGFLALWQKCTHLGCAIPWVEEEDLFHCPCHGSTFNRNGEVLSGPAPCPMDTFPVKISNGEVWVDTSRPSQRRRYDPSQATKA